MVDVIGRAKVIISGDVDSTSIDKAGGKIGSSLKAGALVGVAALGTVAAAGFKAFQAFEQAEAQSRKLTNVLDNMGKADAAPAVEKLADELMRLTAIDDEVIKGGQTILATFDAVAVSAGETGGTFDRATRAAVDMSAVFGSVETASRTLGKALSDPEKAAALLRRSNVILNEEQQTLIDNFVAAGDAAGAQDVILSALEDRYAGTAEAAKTNSADISQAFDELEESAGELVAALAGDGKDGKGGGVSGAIYKVSDALSATAKSPEWENLGKDLRTTGGNVGDLTGGLFRLDKRIGTTILKLPQFGRGLRNLIDPTHGVIGVVLDLVDALKGLNKELEGNSGTIIGNKNNTDFGDSDFINDITGQASGGRNITGGLYLVGEQGPEIMRVPSGADIYSNRESQGMVGGTFELTQIFTGPNSLAEARREADWARTYGTRFGSATSAGAL